MVVADVRIDKALRAQLLARVESLQHTLEAGIAASQAGRTLAPDSVAALREAGIFTLKLPHELGGLEPDPMTQVEVIEAVSYIDASLGWTVCIGNGAISLTAFFPDEGIATIFKDGRIPTMAGVFKPVRGVMVPGGVRVTGRWSWASGIRHAEWVAAHVLVDGEAGQPPSSFIVAMPIEDVTIHDNWHVSGLASTGSCDFSSDDVFIADAFMFDLQKLEPKRGGPFFRMGLPGLLINEFMGLYFGVARRALDEMVALIAPKQRGYGKPNAVADRGVVQRVIGEGDLKLRAVRALAMEILGQAWATVRRGDTPSVAQQVDMRAVTVLAAETAVDIAAKAMRYGGGQAIFLNHVLQRCLRDLETAAVHLFVSDVAYEHRGQLMLGRQVPDPLGA
jgi:alkylation response protein AidB-like acyl-CoA dehydrogenase